jgi:hypothetical protein
MGVVLEGQLGERCSLHVQDADGVDLSFEDSARRLVAARHEQLRLRFA